MRVPKEFVAKNGTRTWRVRFRLDGKQSVESFATKGKAEWFAKALNAVGPREALRLLYEGERADSGPVLDDLLEPWLEWKTPRVRSDRTVADYRRDYRNWIKPTFGQRAAGGITEVDVQNWVEAMSAGTLGKKLKPKSVCDRHAILFGIYGWAIAPARGHVTHNPCIGTELPPRQKGKPKGMRPAEWQAFYAALAQIDTDAADLALFLLATGWRFSEAAALSVYGVEDYGDDQPLYVSMDQVMRRNAAGQHVIVADGKSEAAERRIKLDPEAAAMVRRRIEKVTGDGLVLTTKNGKQWHSSNFRRDAWDPAVKLAQLERKPTPHWLRHTSVAWLVMSGAVSLPEIQRRIGHESIETTIDVYGRMIDDVSDEALDRFAAFRNQQPRAVEPPGSPELER